MKSVRILCTASIGYCTAVFLSHYLLFGESVIAVLALPVMLALSAFLFRGRMRTRLIIAALAMTLGFGQYWLHYDLTVAKCEVFAGKEVDTTARITDFPDIRDRCVLLSVKITDDNLPNVSALIIDYSNEEADFRPGDEIKVKLKLRSVTERFGEQTDSNISKGVYLSGYTSEKIEKTGRWSGSFVYFPKLIGNALHNEIGQLFPEDTAPFMKALLAGYKDDYYGNDKLYASMNVAGLAHVVAVSGMHVAFLIGVLQSILGKNRRSSLICICLVWLFVIMVGSPLSAITAGIMISLLMLANKRQSDYIIVCSYAYSYHKSVFGRKCCSSAVVRRCCRNVSVFAADIRVFQQKVQSAASFRSGMELHNCNAVKLACRDRVHVSAACRAFWLYNSACTNDEYSLPLGDILSVRRRLCRVRRRPCAVGPGFVACRCIILPCAIHSICGRICSETADNRTLHGK